MGRRWWGGSGRAPLPGSVGMGRVQRQAVATRDCRPAPHMRCSRRRCTSPRLAACTASPHHPLHNLPNPTTGGGVRSLPRHQSDPGAGHARWVAACLVWLGVRGRSAACQPRLTAAAGLVGLPPPRTPALPPPPSLAGHTLSWGKSYPDLLTRCYDPASSGGAAAGEPQPSGRLGPMNPARNET